MSVGVARWVGAGSGVLRSATRRLEGLGAGSDAFLRTASAIELSTSQMGGRGRAQGGLGCVSLGGVNSVRDDSLSPNCEQSGSGHAQLFIAAPVVCLCVYPRSWRDYERD